MTDRPVRILLVDDHPLLREGLHRSLAATGFDIVGQAGDGQAAIEAAESLNPDVILMDVTMPVLGGIEATKRIKEKADSPAIVMLTMHSDPQLAREALAAGALGYLVKDCTTEDIVEAIESAMRGEPVFPTEATVDVPNGDEVKSPISQREAEVLQLIADGKSTTDAAKELYLSVKTVKNHLASAYAKLDAHDRTQAVLRAAKLGLIKLDH